MTKWATLSHEEGLRGDALAGWQGGEVHTWVSGLGSPMLWPRCEGRVLMTGCHSGGGSQAEPSRPPGEGHQTYPFYRRGNRSVERGTFPSPTRLGNVFRNLNPTSNKGLLSLLVMGTVHEDTKTRGLHRSSRRAGCHCSWGEGCHYVPGATIRKRTVRVKIKVSLILLG